MFNGTVALQKTASPLPTGIVFGHTNVVVTDSAGAAQTFALNGSETPPWTVSVSNLADGAGTIVATDVDATGAAIGTPISQAFTTAAPSFPATSGITFTPA